MTTTADTNGHDVDQAPVDMPTPDEATPELPAGLIPLADVPRYFAAPARAYRSYLPKLTCRDCSGRGDCSKHKKEKCRKCGTYISTAHVDLDFVGHAEITMILARVDPLWTWEPRAWDEDGGPRYRRSGNGPCELWGTLTVHGKTLPCVGTCEVKPEMAKELIGDLLRNGAMRFGIGTALWSKVEDAERAKEWEREEARAAESPAPAPRKAPAKAPAPAPAPSPALRDMAEEDAILAARAAQAPAGDSALVDLVDHEADGRHVLDSEAPLPDPADWFGENGWLDKTHHDKAWKDVGTIRRELSDDAKAVVKAELAGTVPLKPPYTAQQMAFVRYACLEQAGLAMAGDAQALRHIILACSGGHRAKLNLGDGTDRLSHTGDMLWLYVSGQLAEDWQTNDAGDVVTGVKLIDPDGAVVVEYVEDGEPF